MPSERNFALWFAALCLLIGRFRMGWLIAAAILAGLGFFAPVVLRPFNRAWFRFGLLLARFLNPIVMAILYCAAIIPIGVLGKLVGRDPLRLKIDRAAASYWIHRKDKPQSMLRQF